MPWTVRTRNVLYTIRQSYGIETIRELSALTYKEMRGVRGAGTAVVNEILNTLRDKGCVLPTESSVAKLVIKKLEKENLRLTIENERLHEENAMLKKDLLEKLLRELADQASSANPHSPNQ